MAQAERSNAAAAETVIVTNALTAFLSMMFRMKTSIWCFPDGGYEKIGGFFPFWNSGHTLPEGNFGDIRSISP
jgi:hypothetical protein